MERARRLKKKEDDIKDFKLKVGTRRNELLGSDSPTAESWHDRPLVPVVQQACVLLRQLALMRRDWQKALH